MYFAATVCSRLEDVVDIKKKQIMQRWVPQIETVNDLHQEPDGTKTKAKPAAMCGYT